MKPSNIKIDLWEVLSQETKDKIWEDINEHINDKYGETPSACGFDDDLIINLNVDFESEKE